MSRRVGILFGDQDNPFWQDELTLDDLKWLYTAVTRGVEKVCLVNFKDACFKD